MLGLKVRVLREKWCGAQNRINYFSPDLIQYVYNIIGTPHLGRPEVKKFMLKS